MITFFNILLIRRKQDIYIFENTINSQVTNLSKIEAEGININLELNEF